MGSPFSTRKGGVSPYNQAEEEVKVEKEEKKVEKPDWFEKSKPNPNNPVKSGEFGEPVDPADFESVVGVLPGAGEAVDAKNTIQAMQKGKYGEATLHAAGLFLPVIPGSILVKGAKAVQKFIKGNKANLSKQLKSGTTANVGGVGGDFPIEDVNKAINNNDLDAILKNPKLTDKQKYDIAYDKKMPWNTKTGGVSGEKNLLGADYGKLNKQNVNEVVSQATGGIGQTGRAVDATGFRVSDLSLDNVKVVGNEGGREIFEVTYPSGEKLRFWESSGGGGKAVELSSRNAHLNAKNSKGYFGVVSGKADASAVGGSDGWFIKGEGWERGYGSESIEDTGLWLRQLRKEGRI